MKLFAEMTRVQLRACAAESLVVLPLGATEQHGPHLATGMDFFAVDALTRDAAEAATPEISIVVAPALPYGSSDHHLTFGATLSLSTETYYRVLRELLQSLVTDGFTKIFLVNGHGGNHDLMQLAARDVALKHQVRIGAGSYWNIAWDALVGLDAHRACGLPGHAGDFETSVMLSMRPELVADTRPHRDNTADSDARGFHPPYRVESFGLWREIDGYSDCPNNASAEKGARYRAAVVTALAEAFVAFHRS